MLSLLVVLRVLSKGGSCNSHFSQLTRKECQIPRIGLFELSKITPNKEEEEEKMLGIERKDKYPYTLMLWPKAVKQFQDLKMR